MIDLAIHLVFWAHSTNLLPPWTPATQSQWLIQEYSTGSDWTCGSFDLHFLASNQTWVCISYYDSQANSGNSDYSDVADSDVIVAYDFTQGKIWEAVYLPVVLYEFYSLLIRGLLSRSVAHNRRVLITTGSM